ncbi:T6SS effector amidase Tae4 family protein [Thauera butanivorans]|uniref:T6SS effector amidase Tae4 family protein n=1 Tax=Thauera butanivorans TaxID=86174 RepID=UPI003AB74C6A
MDGGFFKNACAIRMSYVLNKCGVRVPSIGGKTVSGSDGAQYMFRAYEMHRLSAECGTARSD